MTPSRVSSQPITNPFLKNGGAALTSKIIFPFSCARVLSLIQDGCPEISASRNYRAALGTLGTGTDVVFERGSISILAKNSVSVISLGQ